MDKISRICKPLWCSPETLVNPVNVCFRPLAQADSQYYVYAIAQLYVSMLTIVFQTEHVSLALIIDAIFSPLLPTVG